MLEKIFCGQPFGAWENLKKEKDQVEIIIIVWVVGSKIRLRLKNGNKEKFKKRRCYSYWKKFFLGSNDVQWKFIKKQKGNGNYYYCTGSL